MAVKKPAWGVYDIFPTADADRLFIGIVTDTQWEVFCREFAQTEFSADPRLKANAGRVAARPWLLPQLEAIFGQYPKSELQRKLEAIGLPYAPITRPRDLFDDPHLNSGAGMIETRDPRGHAFKVPGLPLELDGARLAQRTAPPALGEGGREILAALGYEDTEIDAFSRDSILSLP